jgi:UDP-glucose 4-epimerase
MSDDQLVILVTGANGFVGRHLVPVLTTNGSLVKQVMRTRSKLSNSVTIEEIGAQTRWGEALSDVDAVVHLAARVHHPREEHAADVYWSVNTAGTLNLARCSAEAGVRQFIYVSTILVNGGSTEGRPPFCEDDIPMPRGVYGLSKAAAEAGLKEIAKDTNMNITVVRPPLIYGNGAIGNFRLLAKAIRRGIPLPFGSIRNRRAFLSVENLVSFIVHRLAHQQNKFDIFLVADDEQVSTPEFVRRIAKALGKNPLMVPLPLVALKSLLRISGRVEAVDSVVGSMELDLSKAWQTGWRAPLTMDCCLRNAVINI